MATCTGFRSMARRTNRAARSRYRASGAVDIAEVDRRLQPVLVPVAVGGHALDIEFQADIGARCLHDHGHVDRVVGGIRGNDRDRLAENACFFEVMLCLVGIEGFRLEVGIMKEVGRGNRLVVANLAKTAQCRRYDLLAVDEVFHAGHEIGLVHVKSDIEVCIVAGRRL